MGMAITVTPAAKVAVRSPPFDLNGGKSLYAFTRTFAHKNGRTPTKVFMLVKSNESPSYTLEDLTWTPVSVVSADGYVDVITVGDLRRYNCAFDVDTGVFTIFHQAYDAMFNTYPAGVQYIPPGASSGNPQPPTNTFFGTGTWRNVTFPPDYHWRIVNSGRLLNYKDSQNNKQLMHVLNNLTDVYASILDPVTRTMIQGPSWTSDQVPGWTPTMAKGFSPMSINVISQDVYILSRNYSFPDTTTLYRFPINSTHPTSPPSQPTTLNFNATQTQCGRLGEKQFVLNFRENPLLVCEWIPPTTVSLINGTELTMLPSIVGGIDRDDMNVLEIVDLPPAVPYLIYQDTTRTFFSVPLSGQSAGAKIYIKKNMTVAEDYGDYPPSAVPTGTNGPLAGWGSGLDKSGSKSSTGAIVGGVCAVVVVVIAVLGFLYYRRRRRQGINKATPNNAPDSSSPTAPVATAAATAQSLNQKPMQQVPPPPLQYLQVYDQDPVELKDNYDQDPVELKHNYDQDQVELKHNFDHSSNGSATQPPVTLATPTHSASLQGYSSYPLTSVPAPTVPVHTRPLAPQRGFP
ncbi:hypothetical protein B0O80DRAFT_528507 [Mortierella sp. GBAus27b]|nr:hypothetical protein B0O80DRAFT_528507 [Mortierella sp. GBAus27b]